MDSLVFTESQLERLKQFTLVLCDIGKASSLDSQLATQLDEVASQITAATPTGNPVLSLGLGEILDIIPQIRASIDLLMTTGYLKQENGDAPASRLRSILADIEKVAGKRLRKTLNARVDGLYVIIDPEVTAGRDPIDVAKGALSGGATMLQLRDKLREKGETLDLAWELKELCSEHDALFIINDHADLAAIVGADGLHIGQGDLPMAEARQILRPRQIIGRSNRLLEEVLESDAQGADHVALGAIYPTTTKAGIRPSATIGPYAIKEVREAVSVPLVAIGGINEDNVEAVVKAGADAICVTSAVGLAANPEQASCRLVEIIRRARREA